MLGGDIAAALPELRAQAESRMRSTCSIASPATTGGVWDEASLTFLPSTPAPVYVGPCRVRVPVAQPGSPVAGEVEYDVDDRIVSLPIATSTTVRAKMRVTVTTSADPALVGEVYEIISVPSGDDLTARRLACKRVT